MSAGNSSSLWFTGRPEYFSSKQNGKLLKASVEEDFIYNLEHYSFLGVKYIVLPADADLNALAAVRKKGLRFPLVYDAEVKVFENPYAKARAFTTQKYSSSGSGLAVDEKHFRPGDAAIIEYSADSVAIKAVSAGPGLLVLTDLHYPGWTATVNGREVTIHKVNGLARGVEVDEGGNTVIFTYRPKSFTLGAAMSVTGLAVTAAAFCIGVVVDRRIRVREEEEVRERNAA